MLNFSTHFILIWLKKGYQLVKTLKSHHSSENNDLGVDKAKETV